MNAKLNTQPNPIQLFDPVSSTYTYILYDVHSRDALIIDPVEEQLERDLSVLRENNLHLEWIVETHAHADHITSAARLAEHTGAKTAAPELCHIRPATLQLQDDATLCFGSETIKALHTPGHTAGSMSFYWASHKAVFTGDALLINGCGRTDFQSGNAAALYHSLTEVLLTLPEDVVVYPGHDYQGQTHSSIGAEKRHNPRVAGKSEAEFIAIMNALNLPQPKRINEAVPANLTLGIRHDAGGSPLPAVEGYAGDISPQLAYDWWKQGDAVLVDVRTDAEREWVGFVPDAVVVAWKHSPDMQLNPHFDDVLKAQVVSGKKVLFMCRSGIRAIAAARRATELGFESYNIIGGFEGELDAHAQRNHLNGWRVAGLPWRQS
ncbi:MBL fold metallo-hydrolase [Hydromonas duriensis]|uniref:Glyoxylase-like metal-dependent hydrolase (Beta-lactamase superfamily II) n=1 Tax=Hydromonas duriensis TaxID=1527608 RepID=A0A4R6Y588_9BURK|nr:MBL fold metallo-hydrolase [Hydromonas duriensis]TDR30186.1 glyoxylase-like metal-dependent hydrolase (beta-lactamase superfamily II) [Hydromonas duriensis]